MVVFRCEQALLDGPRGEYVLAGPVDITCDNGVITAIGPVDPSSTQVQVLDGLVTPSFADAHSHVFHRALRGRTHESADGPGDFWTWRDVMYSAAEKLDPEGLFALSQAAYAEMVCAGVTAVGEFHYLHHGPDGRRYTDPNAMGLALAEAAGAASLDLTLLDVAYLAGGIGSSGEPLALNRVQQRFGDGSIGAWADRVAAIPATIRTGVAIHSVRAVPAADMPTIVAAAGDRWLHVHLSEQPAENDATLAAYGLTPTQVLERAGAIGPRTAAVHATHLSAADIEILGTGGASIVMCPATEADLADGIGPARELATAGARISLGSDQHVVTDPIAQARGLEYGERLATGIRGRFTPNELWRAATVDSHRCIGSAGGRLAVGAPADLVALRTNSSRTAGSRSEQLIMSASAADVAVVVAKGRVVARDGVHLALGDPGELLGRALGELWKDANL
ncbi:formimidoylglutamate deiminase [Nakamurella silvestris]|nr:formimidoylglutamate deiminase [Nakamurella silvestris]